MKPPLKPAVVPVVRTGDELLVCAQCGRRESECGPTLPDARGVGVFWLAGCAIRPITPELTHVDRRHRLPPGFRRVVPDNDPHTLLVLTFSGGGTRAAAFSFGVLEELRRTVVHAAGRAPTPCWTKSIS